MVELEGSVHTPDGNVIGESVGVVVRVADDLGDGAGLLASFVLVQAVLPSHNFVAGDGRDGAVSGCDDPVRVDDGTTTVVTTTLDLDDVREVSAACERKRMRIITNY